jgi:hypothetical protein
MKKLLALAAAALLVSAAPLAAFTLIERGSTFEITVRLQQAAFADGSAKLAPGEYKVKVSSLGDGSVHASFIDHNGKTAGESRGIIAVLRQGAASHGAGAPGEANAQKVQPGGTEATINFAKVGFNGQSKYAFRMEGQNLKLDISSNDGSLSILIGLLLPAVQKVR